MKWKHLRFGAYSGTVNGYLIEIDTYIVSNIYKINTYRIADNFYENIPGYINIQCVDIIDKYKHMFLKVFGQYLTNHIKEFIRFIGTYSYQSVDLNVDIQDVLDGFFEGGIDI